MTNSVSALATELAGTKDTEDLAVSLAQVCVKLGQHWAHTYLIWFTDHGVGHAQRVAAHALTLGDLPNPPLDIKLSALERYILCAASLLHDIGMNDLSLSPRPLGAMQPQDYEAVRHRHSSQSGSMIINDPAAWGLPAQDPVLAEVVGLVAQAHGTQNYRKTIPLLEERTRVRNQLVRGPLLAALLLMADELDLYYKREVNIPGNVRLNAVSEAHAFKHRCISSALSRTSRDGTIVLHLQLSIPSTLSKEYKADIQRWIVGKLRRQMALVDPQIAQGFAKNVRFERAIKVEIVSSLSPRPLPSPEALAVVRAEIVADDLIDHREKLRRIRTALREKQHVVITGEWTAETRLDFHGREDLYQATVAGFVTDPNAVVVCSRRLRDLGSGEASDVLEEWARDLNVEYDFGVADQGSESSARAALLDACIAAGRALDNSKFLIFAVSCFDLLGEEGKRWLGNIAIPRIAKESSPDLRLLLTADSDSHVPVLDPQVSVIPTEELDTDEVIDHLSGVGLKDAEIFARSDRLSYHDLKHICSLKTMSLQEQESK